MELEVLENLGEDLRAKGPDLKGEFHSEIERGNFILKF